MIWTQTCKLRQPFNLLYNHSVFIYAFSFEHVRSVPYLKHHCRQQSFGDFLRVSQRKTSKISFKKRKSRWFLIAKKKWLLNNENSIEFWAYLKSSFSELQESKAEFCFTKYFSPLRWNWRGARVGLWPSLALTGWTRRVELFFSGEHK